MNVFCIKNVKRDNINAVCLFLEKINCFIQASVLCLDKMSMHYHCDIFIDKPTDDFTRYCCCGQPFFSWVGNLDPNYKHPVIDADDLKGGGRCIVNPRELTTTIIILN